MSLSPALLSALQSIQPALGTSFTRLSSDRVRSDTGQELFVKEGRAVRQMEAEAKSLEAIAKACPGLAPKVYTFDSLDDGKSSIMISDYFNLTSFSASAKTSLARRMASEMHNPENKNALSPEAKYGFPVNTFCGETEMDNTWETSWPTFFTTRRIGDLCTRISRKRSDSELDKLSATIQDRVIPLLLPEDADYPPVIIHGDLWSGNVAGKEGGKDEAVVYDPSSFYGHNEAELGIMRMFGGFGSTFFDEYHSIRPKMQPFYDERARLYELWHHLNHWLIFGSTYRSGSISIMRELVAFADKQEAKDGGRNGKSKV